MKEITIYRRLRKLTNIGFEELRRLVNSLAVKGGIVQERTPLKSGINEKNKKEDGMKQSQKLLLTWLIEDTGLFKKINGYISENDFTEDLYHRVAVMVFTQFKTDGAVNPAKNSQHVSG